MAVVRRMRGGNIRDAVMVEGVEEVEEVVSTLCHCCKVVVCFLSAFVESSWMCRVTILIRAGVIILIKQWRMLVSGMQVFNSKQVQSDGSLCSALLTISTLYTFLIIIIIIKGRGGRGGRGRGRGRGGGRSDFRSDNGPYNGPILELKNPMMLERQQSFEPRQAGGRFEGRGEGRGGRGRGEGRGGRFEGRGGRGEGRGGRGGRDGGGRDGRGGRTSSDGAVDNNTYASGRDPSKGPSRDINAKRKPGAGRGRGRGGGRFDDDGGRRGGRVSLRIGTGKRGRQSEIQQRRGSLRKKDRSREKAMKEERAIERRTVFLPG